MAVSIDLGSSFVGVLKTRALLLGVYIQAPDVLEFPIYLIGNIAGYVLRPQFHGLFGPSGFVQETAICQLEVPSPSEA